MKKTLKQLLPIVLAFALLAYALRGMPLASLLDQLYKASPLWITVTALVMGLQTLLRAVRWRMLLQGLGYTPSTGRAMSAMLAGSASGLIIPGSGELLRCTLLQRSDKVPITESVGSIITERLVDLLATAVLLTLTILLESGRLLAYVRQYMQPPAWLLAMTTGQWIGVAIAFFLSVFLGIRGLKTLAKRASVQRLSTRFKVRERVNGFRRGLLSIRIVDSPSLYWLTTFFIHSLSLVVLTALFRALPVTETLPNSAALTVFALTSLGSLTIPTQASIGSYHFLASRGLVAYGLPILAGTVWATFSHAVITVVNLMFSALGFLAALRFLRGRQTYKVSKTL
ncbi:lysylphosphatidylglycerol synthase transmembrane domain-containing protein [Fibrella forsythiae]|uniref:Flippase-like domain-containing protein n=1 Tax=Fibrella forsythiae TaxID=2817061 RepID=A0ABS3JJ66_9BACT|nr:lysylphosphatidylglycerol synthase transmembrane domain-containing protein [Fibrella forsythiae]MBO0950052.1 flippase-like domain-containing protein [Fibrella forsythiae]